MKDKNKDKEFVSNEDINMDDLTNEQPDCNPNETNEANLSEQEISWEEKYQELNNSYLRLHAEFDNYRKRTIKEKADLLKTGGEKIMLDILPVVDDFERAIENIEKVNDVESLKEGVELIYNKFVSFLLKHGVKKMEVLGEKFDTEMHEALTTTPAPSEDMVDKIIDCVQEGYTLDDKVIRYPKVVVAK